MNQGSIHTYVEEEDMDHVEEEDMDRIRSEEEYVTWVCWIPLIYMLLDLWHIFIPRTTVNCLH